jgi:diguanylate cyclase
VAERIRKRVEECHFLVDGNDIRLTVSIGLAAYPEHATSTEQLIQMADDAMYSGKHKSRNVVYIAS